MALVVAVQSHELKLGHLVPVVDACFDAHKSFTLAQLHGGVAFVEVAVLHALDVDDGVLLDIH